MMKANPAELARIAQNKSVFPLSQNEMIMLPGKETGWFHAQASAHPEVDPDPVLAGKRRKASVCRGLLSQGGFA